MKSMKRFKLKSDFNPTGDQPQAIEKLSKGVSSGQDHQVLLGVTGSGKTFTVANVIEKIQKPTLVISHNKTLAGQLFQEFREFFPENSVNYFVSYYDYYQPEAYVPQRDLYIEKEANINKRIEVLRHSATQSLMARKDVLVVASVSCIYGLGRPDDYFEKTLELEKGQGMKRIELLRDLINLLYARNDMDFKRGAFRVRGERVEIFPPYGERALRVEMLGGKIRGLSWIEPESGAIKETVDEVRVFPAEHFITPEKRLERAIELIKIELKERVKALQERGQNLEAHRLKQRTEYDLELLKEMGFCPGIENYARYLSGREKGEPPFTLLDYFRYASDDFLCIIDESHQTIPQIRGMYNGDQARKKTLVEHGFRLPSALDNRPLKFDEFLKRVPRIIHTSATPNDWEINKSSQVVEQLIRPTGVLDPKIEVRPARGQVKDLIKEIVKRIKKGERVLAVTLTKRMAETLSEYLASPARIESLLGKKVPEIKTHYLHSEIDTLERSEILLDLRKGEVDVVVGINLLREGLDLPEVSLVAILDADKEGFLRSETSLIQTMGRAARNLNGKAILYGDRVTGSMKRAIDEVERRRKVQKEYNEKHGIKPQTIKKPFRRKILPGQKKKVKEAKETWRSLSKEALERKVINWEKTMRESAENLNFEKAAELRDKIREAEKVLA